MGLKRNQQLTVDDLSHRLGFRDIRRSEGAAGIRKIVNRNRNPPSLREYTQREEQGDPRRST